jgi:hypothetical protein
MSNLPGQPGTAPGQPGAPANIALRYNGPLNGTDRGWAVAINAGGDLFLTGPSVCSTQRPVDFLHGKSPGEHLPPGDRGPSQNRSRLWRPRSALLDRHLDGLRYRTHVRLLRSGLRAGLSGRVGQQSLRSGSALQVLHRDVRRRLTLRAGIGRHPRRPRIQSAVGFTGGLRVGPNEASRIRGQGKCRVRRVPSPAVSGELY